MSAYRTLARVERARLRVTRSEEWLLTRGPGLVSIGHLSALAAVGAAAVLRFRGPVAQALLLGAAVLLPATLLVAALRRRVERRLDAQATALSLAEPLRSPVAWIDDRAYTLLTRDPLHWALSDDPPSRPEGRPTELAPALSLYEATPADALEVPPLDPPPRTAEGTPAELHARLASTPELSRALRRLPWPYCCRRLATLRTLDLTPERPNTLPHLRWLPIFQCSACARVYSIDRR